MIPDYCEAITAYRVWDVHKNGLLVGQAHAEPWPPYQPFMARCGAASARHIQKGVWMPPPLFSCDCGIHAVKTYEAAEARLKDETSGYLMLGHGERGPYRVWGTVKLWGRVIEHDDGWRAEYAYPSDVFCEDEKIATRVAALYGVPCVVREQPRHPPIVIEGDWDPLNAGWITLGNPMQGIAPIGITSWKITWADAAGNPVVDPSPPAPATQQAIDKHLGRSRWQQRQQTKPASRPGFREKRSR